MPSTNTALARPRPISPRTTLVRALNDTLRRYGMGGRTVHSPGVAGLPANDRAMVLWAVSKFGAFDPDPEGEHLCGRFDTGGYDVAFVITNGDTRLYLDADAAPRTLTIMLGFEFERHLADDPCCWPIDPLSLGSPRQ